MLRSRLEQQLADATFEGEDIDEEELCDVSGRARFLKTSFAARAGSKRSAAQTFEEYITVPGCSSRLLGAVAIALRDDSPARGYSVCVRHLFRASKVRPRAHESDSVYDKMAAVYGAYDNTRALINLLQMVYHNVKHYFPDAVGHARCRAGAWPRTLMQFSAQKVDGGVHPAAQDQGLRAESTAFPIQNRI